MVLEKRSHPSAYSDIQVRSIEPRPFRCPYANLLCLFPPPSMFPYIIRIPPTITNHYIQWADLLVFGSRNHHVLRAKYVFFLPLRLQRLLIFFLIFVKNQIVRLTTTLGIGNGVLNRIGTIRMLYISNILLFHSYQYSRLSP
jgi:hypothetical protein